MSATTAAARRVDDLAAWSFVTGLVGLLVFNVILGPLAVILGARALTRGTTRRGRATFGVALGVADLVLFASLAAADSTAFWHLS
ncbi:hypothetical protein RM780_01135 [Streptomyces sp. DSM 44917]|uniref:DUF4190 domain-containing protein n=1 Tax=Streptomyces boetiae TaxID=3075541 RepID=A0ABU2L1Z1_9ACTN|nr:hypothetical protein [Streptomyces sp. DSM 44917]MDT0305570.1 hypothetical protein [Streptomyces sp. DSM 44917]